MKKFLIPLLFLLTFSTSVNASPWTQMIKGGLKGSLKSGSSGNNKESFKLGEKCIKGNCSEIIGILTTSTDEFTGETMCISYLKGERYLSSFMAPIGTFIFPISKEKNIQYRLDNGSINSVIFGDLKYYWGHYPPLKADFSNGDSPPFYMKKVLWDKAKTIKFRYIQNYSDKIDYTYKTNALNRYVKETRKCWSKYDKDFLVERDKFNKRGPDREPIHID